MAVFGGSGGSATVSSDFRVYTFNHKNLQQKNQIRYHKIASNMA